MLKTSDKFKIMLLLVAVVLALIFSVEVNGRGLFVELKTSHNESVCVYILSSEWNSSPRNVNINYFVDKSNHLIASSSPWSTLRSAPCESKATLTVIQTVYRSNTVSCRIESSDGRAAWMPPVKSSKVTCKL